MPVNPSDAVAAYNRAAQQLQTPGLEARGKTGGGDFAEALRGAMEGAVQNLNQGEKMSVAAAAGQADINEVITAVSKAELTLQTVVTLRDRVVQAYQDILRMPI